MDEDARTPDMASVGDLDRRLLRLLHDGHSAVEAGAMLGLTLAGTAVRLQAVRRRLGVADTAAAVQLVWGEDPPSNPPHSSPGGRRPPPPP